MNVLGNVARHTRPDPQGQMVDVRQVNKKFSESMPGNGVTHALTSVDLSIGRGQVMALLGPNGAGKTTLVRVLTTLVRPDSGQASVAGHDVVADPAGDDVVP